MKQCKSQVPEKSRNSYKIKQKHFFGPNGVQIALWGRTKGLSEIRT